MEDALKKKLLENGLNDRQITLLEKEGVATSEDMAMLGTDEIKSVTKCGLIVAKKLRGVFAPIQAERAIGENLTEADIPHVAAKLGVDQGILSMMMLTGLSGQGQAGVGMDMSVLMPVTQIISGYNPKIRDLIFLIMGQVEARLDVGPIIAINADGSVNADVTAQYVLSLEEGFPPAEDAVYYSTDGAPHELIRVGVDAQSVYDADPVDSSRALQKNGIGLGRIAWNKISPEVRQVVYFAVRETREINPSSETDLQWLRDNIKHGVTRVALRMKWPKANAMWNEANRTGALPTLRIQLSRPARRPQVGPSRRNALPRDLNEKGGATSGSGKF